MCASFLSPCPVAIWQHTPAFMDLLRTYLMLSTDLGTKNYPVASTDTIPALKEFAV